MRPVLPGLSMNRFWASSMRRNWIRSILHRQWHYKLPRTLFAALFHFSLHLRYSSYHHLEQPVVSAFESRCHGWSISCRIKFSSQGTKRVSTTTLWPVHLSRTHFILIKGFLHHKYTSMNPKRPVLMLWDSWAIDRPTYEEFILPKSRFHFCSIGKDPCYQSYRANLPPRRAAYPRFHRNKTTRFDYSMRQEQDHHLQLHTNLWWTQVL